MRPFGTALFVIFLFIGADRIFHAIRDRYRRILTGCLITAGRDSSLVDSGNTAHQSVFHDDLIFLIAAGGIKRTSRNASVRLVFSDQTANTARQLFLL